MNEELIDTLAEGDDDDDINTVEIGVEDTEQDFIFEDIIEVIEVEPAEEIEIDIDESIGWVGGDSTRHYSLVGREENDQHPITAITGLREELDEIEALKTVQSDKIGIANYYEWYNGASYDEFGYFVSLVPHTSSIEICDGTDIFGVTVENAGFVGGQSASAPRSNNYALVVTSGVVDVRCESDVAEGDYVISNSLGVAEKTASNGGYKVIAIEDKHGIKYAVISLGVQACTTDIISKDVQNLSERMDDAEINIAATVKLANDAYNKSVETTEISEEAIRNALEALKRADDAVNTSNSTGETIESISHIVAQTQAIANGAVSSANDIRKEAVEVANSSWVKALELKDEMSALAAEMEPLASWESEDKTKRGIAGFIARADANSATLATLAEWKEDGGDNQSIAGTISKVNDLEAILNHLTDHQGTMGSTIAQVEQKADDAGASITHLVAGIDKYSVGEYSQAYGLTLEQARKILKIGTIYIPTKHESDNSHSEKYNINQDDFWTSTFTYGYYYEWEEISENVIAWSESIGEVYFGPNQPAGPRYTYWYDDINLYLLNEGEWIKVATLAGNPNNRAMSMIRQNLDSISVEVTNARGSFSNLTARLSDTESRVTTTAQWAKGKDQYGEKMYNMAVVEQTANQDGSSLALTVADVNGNKVVEGANIVLNQSGGESYITLEADKIVTNGEAFFTTSNGQTLIDGSKIITKTLKASDLNADTLQSNKYEPGSSGSVYSNTGMFFDLNQGSISAKYFAVDSDGKVWAKSGKIADFTLDSIRLYSPYVSGKLGVGISSSTTQGDPAFYAGFKGNSTYEQTPWSNSNWANDTKFYVTNTGYLKATDAYIEGEIRATKGSFTGEVHAEKGLIGDALIENGHLTFPSSENLILNGQQSFSLAEGGSPLFSSYRVANLEYFTPGTYTLTASGKVGSKASSGRQIWAYLVFMKKDANGTEKWWTSTAVYFSSKDYETKSHTFTISSDTLSQCSSIHLLCHYTDSNGTTCTDGMGTGSAIQWAVLTKGYRKAARPFPSIHYNTNVNKNLLSPISSGIITGCGIPVTNNKYEIAQYLLNDEGRALEQGTICTIQIKAKLGKGKTHIGVYNSGGMCELAGLYWINHFDNDEGIYVKTFKWNKKYTSGGTEYNASNTDIRIYMAPSTVDSESTIEWVKLEVGSVATAFNATNNILDSWTATSTLETTITGGRVDTGLINAEKLKVDYIKSSNCTNTAVPGTYTSAGTFIDLKNGGIYSKNFYIDSLGDAFFKGEVSATKGYIGPWAIENSGISVPTITEDEAEGYIHIGTSGIETHMYGMEESEELYGDRDTSVNVRGDGIGLDLYLKTDAVSVGSMGFGNSIYGQDITRSTFLIRADTHGHLLGFWTADNDLSDVRIKNTIEGLSESYEILFDNLQPRRYKYNNGTSNRFHTGYVAQEVVEAIEASGLTTQDFAGVVLSNLGKENEMWYLRRDEFVPLNTWQIQKLKPRVATLEEKVQVLEAENAELKEQLKLLLNPNE